MKGVLLTVVYLFIFHFSQSQPPAITRHLRVLDLPGSGYERGLEHGRKLKKEIAELLVLWKKSLENEVHIPADTFIHDFLTSTSFLSAIKKYTPDVLEEVRGIAEGSGQPFKDIYAFQLVDEYWVYEDKLQNAKGSQHCSGIGIPSRSGRPAYVSQNLDVESWMDGYQIVLHILGDVHTPEQYVLSCAGLVALNGINHHGIALCVNTLMELQASPDGLPVAFMIRGVLAQNTGAAALKMLTTAKHASGQNYILGIGDSVYDFEASANSVIRMAPDAAGLVYHTNHPVANIDIKPWYKEYYEKYLAGKTQNFNSEIRFATLKRRASDSQAKDDAFIKTTLRSKDDAKNPVCVTHLPDRGGFTFGSVIFSLSDKRTMEVTAGPPDESEYKLLTFVRH